MKLLELFKRKAPVKAKKSQTRPRRHVQTRSSQGVVTRKGEIGEYKIDVQLSQLPKAYKYFNDIMLENPKSVSGYSQIDHLVISPYGLFVVETKNYQGTIYGGKDRRTWTINGKFEMLNPVLQNYGHIKALKQYVDSRFHSQIMSLITFTKRSQLKIDNDMRGIHANPMAIYDIFLSETINRKVHIAKLKAKAPILSEEDMQEIYSAIAGANITDTKVRDAHSRSIQEAKQQGPKCVICNKPVSQRVKSYCLANKRFNGKVYCYEHQ